jgi:hypothetical protein
MRTLFLLLAACNPPLPEGEPEPEPEGVIGPDGGVLASEDGVLTLTIPEGALAADTEMSIAAVAEADWPADVAALEPIGGVVYDVQPEGTVFSAPVTFQWAFATAPEVMFDEQGLPRFVAANSRSEDGVIAPHAKTTRSPAGDRIESSAEHLSLHWLTHRDAGTVSPFGVLDVDLNGGRHGVGEVWPANHIIWTPGFGLYANVYVIAMQQGVVEPVVTEDYVDADANVLYVGDADVAGYEPWSPPLPLFRCNAAGTDAARVEFSYVIYASPIAVVSALADEPVTCEEQKAAFTDAEAALGEDRIAPLGVPDTTSVNLEDNAGAYGFLVDVPAGGSVKVCVDTTGSASVTYTPRFHPGFDFVDNEPGCTTVTNKDAAQGNQVLVTVEGTGTATVTTSVP